MNTIYEEYEKKQKGLYYEVLVKKFPSMKFDERYEKVSVKNNWTAIRENIFQFVP